MLFTYSIPLYRIIDPTSSIERQTPAIATFDASQWFFGLLYTSFQFSLLTISKHKIALKI